MKNLFAFILMLSFVSFVHARDNHDDMHDAIVKNDVAKVRALLKAKTNPNLRKDTRASPTFLTQASRLGRDEIVSLLLAAGADVNGTDGDQMTALMQASWNGHVKLVETLLKAGANVDEKSKWGDTALSFAKEKNYTEVIPILLKAGAK